MSIYLTNREASTVRCSVVKHAGSGSSTNQISIGRNTQLRLVFLPTS